MELWYREDRDTWRWRFKDKNGEWHTGFERTRKEAQAAGEAEMAKFHLAPMVKGNPDLTFGAYAEHWLKTQNVKKRTIESYAQLYTNHLAAPLGPMRLRDIQRSHIKQLLADKQKQGLSRNTCRLIRATVSVMFGDAIEEGRVATNPATMSRRRKGTTISKVERVKAIRPFSDFELTRVLDAAVESMNEYATLFLLLARTGMRPGEAFALQVDDLDLTRKKILVERGLSGGEVGTNKTDDRREVDMSEELAIVLASMLEQREALGEGETRVYARWIPSNDGGYVHLLDAAGKSVVPDSTNMALKPKKPLKINAPSETRTPDPLIKSQLLYQLS
jgi:integrase